MLRPAAATSDQPALSTPGTDGLIHISHLAEGRVEKVTDVLQEGDEVLAKCIEIDPTGRIRLSRKEALVDALAEADA